MVTIAIPPPFSKLLYLMVAFTLWWGSSTALPPNTRETFP